MQPDAKFPNMNLLRQFVVVADQKGVARAARTLGMSQPALSKNMRNLESVIGATLFDRHTKGTALSNHGEALYHRVVNILLEYEHAMQDVHNSLSGIDSVIRIGAGPMFAAVIIPAAMRIFHHHYPRHRVVVDSFNADALTDELRTGRVDLVAGLIPDHVGNDIKVSILRQARLCVLSGPAHPLAKQSAPVEMTQLSQYPFVSFRPDHNLMLRLASRLRECNAPPPHYSIETSSLYGTLDLLKDNHHLYFGSEVIVEHPIGQGLSRLHTAHPFYTFGMGVMHKKGKEKEAAVAGLISLIRQGFSRTTPS